MSRQQDLQDMRALLQQMREMEGYAVPEHCEGWYQDAKQSAAKKLGRKTDEVKLEEYFTDLSDDDARKTALNDLMDITNNPHDIFDVLAKHITADKLLNIVFDHDMEKEHGTKTEHGTKISQARDEFKTYSLKDKKLDLKAILTQLWSEGITPLAVFKELVKQMMIRNEMKAWLKPAA